MATRASVSKRDDGLMLVRGTSGPLADRSRKELHAIFNNLGLKITADVNNHTVNFPDITLNLQEGSFSPYRKPNNDPLYIDHRSNHPPSVIKQLPKSVGKRISALSSNESCFNSAKPLYENSLKRSNYDVKLQYLTKNENSTNSNPQSSGRNRKRKIIWFNPPYSKNVKTNIARKFLQLLDKHFPKTSRLHKIFNRSSIKVSYSCMSNIKTSISNHNRRLLEQQIVPPSTGCNCRTLNECPLNEKCLTESLVYQAEITSTDAGEAKTYIGMTGGSFKKRYANHKKSINNPRYSSETELSKYIWDLKKKKQDFTINWSILKRVVPRAAGRNTCNLCLEEKLSILESNSARLLNKRSQLFSKCRHRFKFSARNFKRTRN